MFDFGNPWMADGSADAGKVAQQAMAGMGAVASVPMTAALTTAAAMAAGSFAMMFGWQAVMLRAMQTSPFMAAYATGGETGKPAAEPGVGETVNSGTAAGVARPAGLEAPRGKADDLKRISGIGPKLEIVLNDLGIYHYGQIAAWSGQEIDWVDDYLKFKGRIGRDKWQAQARRLMENMAR
jgi:NADH-quinone oxidoreductase subunit E